MRCCYTCVLVTDDCQDLGEHRGLSRRDAGAAVSRRMRSGIPVGVIVDGAKDPRLTACAGDVPHVERDALALARDTEMSHAPMAHADTELNNQASAREPVWACQGALR